MNIVLLVIIIIIIIYLYNLQSTEYWNDIVLVKKEYTSYDNIPISYIYPIDVIESNIPDYILSYIRGFFKNIIYDFNEKNYIIKDNKDLIKKLIKLINRKGKNKFKVELIKILYSSNNLLKNKNNIRINKNIKNTEKIIFTIKINYYIFNYTIPIILEYSNNNFKILYLNHDSPNNFGLFKGYIKKNKYFF